jgi:hypothetical protein
VGAINSAAATQPGLSQWNPTSSAIGSATAINIQFQLEISGFAMAADEVPKGGSATFDGMRENFLNIVSQPIVAIGANTASRTQGMNSRSEQGLISVNVANSHHDMTIHQEAFYRHLSISGALEKVCTTKSLFQGLRAQTGQ